MSLVMFPENAVIRKRNAINLWIGEGLVQDTENETAEELCERVISDLFESNMIVLYGNGKSPIVNKFRILHAVHRMLKSHVTNQKACLSMGSLVFRAEKYRLVFEQKRVTVGDTYFGGYTVFNIGASYVNFRPKWITELKNVEVLQLGR